MWHCPVRDVFARWLCCFQCAANNAWQEIVASAERHNQPGEFTALIGYEWSSTPNGDNLHRVVMYRDGADRVSQTHPVSVIAAMVDPTVYHPETLWRACKITKIKPAVKY